MRGKQHRSISTQYFLLGLFIGYFSYLLFSYNMDLENTSSEVETNSGSYIVIPNPTNHLSVSPRGQVFYQELSKAEDPLKKKVRVLCWVMTFPAQHLSRAAPINRTWGKRCNKLLFMSTKPSTKLDVVILDVLESKWNLQRKTQAAWKHVYSNHLEDFDWFLAVEDDTYVIMDNLRQFLNGYTPYSPISFGHVMQNEGSDYLSKRPGYVLSREATRRLVRDGFNQIKNHECGSLSWSYDDIAMGTCLESVGVKQHDTRDSQGRLRFLSLPLQILMSITHPGRIQLAEYWSSHSKRSFKRGMECCSDKPIAFHEMQPKQMLLFEYMIYHLHPYGFRVRVNKSEAIVNATIEGDRTSNMKV